jgi:hypothetical protein
MRRFRQLCAGIALACILAVSGSAGDISCGVTDDQSAATQETAVAGEMPNGIESTDTVTELVISFLTTILPLV